MSAFENICAAVMASPARQTKGRIAASASTGYDAIFFEAMKRLAESKGYPVHIGGDPPDGWDGDLHDGTTFHACDCPNPNCPNKRYTRGVFVRSRDWHTMAHECVHVLRGLTTVDPIEFGVSMSRRVNVAFDPADPADRMKAMQFVIMNEEGARDWLRQREEWIVELTLAFVGERYGFDTSYSTDYLARYQATTDDLKELLPIVAPLVAEVAAELMHAVGTAMREREVAA